MAITLSALDMFRNASAWTDNTKLNLNGQGGVGNAGNYGGILSARSRQQPEKDANNAVRTALLKALAKTFNLATDPENDGTRFSPDFMRKLEKLLGPAFKRDDFKVGADGVVSSGRPLTARRIKAILSSAKSAADDGRDNDSIFQGFRDAVSTWPEEAGFLEMVAGVYNDVKDRFGEQGVTTIEMLHELVPPSEISSRICGPGKKRVTPEAMRGWYAKLAIAQGAKRLATHLTRQIIQAKGGDGGDAARLFSHVAIRHPEILRSILSTKNPAAAQAAFGKFAQLVEKEYDRFVVCERVRSTFIDTARNALARRLGVPVGQLGGIDQLFIRRYGEDLRNAILDGKDPADGEEAIRAAFERRAEQFAEERVNAFAKIDRLDVPVSAKDFMKMHLLADNKIHYLKFDRIFQAGANLPAGNLRELLDANASKDDIYNAMKRVSMDLEKALETLFADDTAAGKEIGPDEIANAKELVLEVFFGKNPGLRDAVKAFLKRPDVLEDGIHDKNRPAYSAFYFEPVARDRNGNDIPSAKEHVLENLGTDRLFPVYTQALVTAARELGRDDPPDAILALFATGTPAGDNLRAALGQFDGELDSAKLKALATEALRRA